MVHPVLLVSRRRHVLALRAVRAAAGLSACNWLKDVPVTVAAHVWVGYQPMFLARDRGWLEADRVTLLQTRLCAVNLSAAAALWRRPRRRR